LGKNGHTQSYGPVHFFLTWGELRWQYRRALETAKVHGAPIILWYLGPEPDVPEGVEPLRLVVPPGLQDAHPATLYDICALKKLFEHGGMALGLDSISVRPAFDLLGNAEVMVGSDVPLQIIRGYVSELGQVVSDPFNNHIIARAGSHVLWEMYEAALARAKDTRWGATGPLLMTEFVHRGDVAVAPFPTLCGWEGSYIWRFYDGEEPGPDVRVIHLFSSAYPEQFARCHWTPSDRQSEYAPA
jgi:hypothetical protein